MRLTILCVGRPGRLLAGPIADYERRVGRYFQVETVEVATGGGGPTRVRSSEGDALLARMPERHRVFALTRDGDPIDSRGLAAELEDIGTYGPGGAAWIIGGAFGLSAAVLDRADRRVSLSALTFPHELARLVLAEQLYRAGTILRGEPYHKGA